MNKELVMYSRSYSCPFVTLAKRVLNDYHVTYRELYIDQDSDARERVVSWTGFLSVPTLIVAEAGEVLPYEPPKLLEKGYSPRGIDRGSMITEPNADELANWLHRHDFIEEVIVD